jgi:hypothetical protein
LRVSEHRRSRHRPRTPDVEDHRQGQQAGRDPARTAHRPHDRPRDR